MNDEIHSARYVTKTHTTNVATFRTPTLGPIGLVTKHRILFMQELLETTRLDITSVNGTIPIVKAYAGMQGDLLEAIAHTKVDGFRSWQFTTTSCNSFEKIISTKNPSGLSFPVF